MRLIGLGAALVILGFLVVFLTALRVVDANLPLLLLAYGGSFAGLCIGYAGIAQKGFP